MFVVFEGLDKSGKTTLCRSVYNKFIIMKKSVELIHFPDRSGAIGKLLNEYLTRKVDIDPETTHLLFTADRYAKKSCITEKRKSNILLCDRYSWSGISCSVAKGVSMDWCIETEKLLPKPDITFYLDCDIDVVMNRRGWGEEVLEDRDTQIGIKEAYSYMDKYENRVIHIDCTKSQDELTEICIKEIQKMEIENSDIVKSKFY